MSNRKKTRPILNDRESSGGSARVRHRETAMSWLALGVLLSAWHMEARLTRGHEAPTNSRVSVAKAFARQPAWTLGSRARSWISHATSAATAAGIPHVVPPASVYTPVTTLRLIRRWLPDV